MIIDYKKISKISIEYFKKYYTLDKSHHIYQQHGEHYKLLTYISSIFNNITILDVGTAEGFSALALAQNPTNKVITYDIENIHYPKLSELPFLNDYPNITRKIMDINNESSDVINSADIILLDIVHDGKTENIFSDMLDRIQYKGYVFCDDVFSKFHPKCTAWFKNIKFEKYDLTEIGHHTGTGLLNYNKNNKVIINKTK